MYDLFKDKPNRLLGQALDPNIVYIRRTYLGLINDVKNYYRYAPKHIASDNLLALLIQQFVINYNLNDSDWLRQVEVFGKGISRNLGITSSINRGRIHSKGITLGPQCEEIIVEDISPFTIQDINKNWYKLVPVKYLYHTRTDVNLPIMNNTTPGKGYGVISVNIPMLLLQYRYWLLWQLKRGITQPENVYRFIGSIVLPNMVESYLDIAFFNRIDRQAQGIKNFTYPLSHPFYLTDMSARLDKLAVHINQESLLKGIEIEGLAWITPMIVKDNLFNLIKSPRTPISYQNEWAYVLAKLPYIKYLFGQLLKNPGFDRSQVNAVMIDLIDATNAQVFNTIGNSDFVKTTRQDIRDLISRMKAN